MSEDRNASSRSAVVAAAALASRRARSQTPQLPQVGPSDSRYLRAAAAANAVGRLSHKAQKRPSPSISSAGPSRPPVYRNGSTASTDSDLSNLSSSSTRTLTPTSAVTINSTNKSPQRTSITAAAAASAARQSVPSPSRPGQVETPTTSPAHAQADALAAASARKIQEAKVAEADKISHDAKLYAAAARTSTLNPVKVEPKQTLQDRILKVFNDEKPDTKLNAVAAAALARTNADTEIARVSDEIRLKRERKARFRPAASWSAPLDMPQQPGTAHNPFHGHNPLHMHPMGGHVSSHLTPSASKLRLLSQLEEKTTSPAQFLKGKMLKKLGLIKGEGSSAPSSPDLPAAATTLRKDKKSKFNEHKPWKNHAHAKTLTEKERRRYERLWAANKGTHSPFFLHELAAPASPAASNPSLPLSGASTLPVGSMGSPNGAANGAGVAGSQLPRLTVTDFDPDSRSVISFRSSIVSTDSDQYDSQSEEIHGFAVANLWHRSQLPDDVLEKIWALVDHNYDGTLDRESFIVGTWLVDQCLYGRKLPSKVSDQIWTSAGRLNVKIRVKNKGHHNKKFLRTHHKKTAAGAAALLASRESARSPVPEQR